QVRQRSGDFSDHHRGERANLQDVQRPVRGRYGHLPGQDQRQNPPHWLAPVHHLHLRSRRQGHNQPASREVQDARQPSLEVARRRAARYRKAATSTRRSDRTMRQTRDSRQEELGNNTVQPALEPGSRGLPIARGVDTINQFGYPRVSEEGRVRRNLVMTEGNSPQPGLWSFALPGIIQGSTAAPELHALDNNGRADPNHKPFPRWQLPDGTKDVAPGTTGIIVAGTDLDEDRVIFHPDAAVGLRVNHLGTKRPAGESIVFGTDEFDQLDGDGGLSSAFYVVALPPQMGRRYVISLNAMSLEDKNLDGNMAFVFNKVGQYAGQLGERIVGMGVWNRNGPFAADPTNATELGRNNRQIPFRAIML